jgi:HAD superfamily hydrolase (TIGR01509 family)
MSELFALGGKSLKDLDPDAFLGGDNSLQWAAFLRNLLGLSMTDDEIVQWVVERIVSRYEGRLPLISGAVEAVARLAATYPLGLASSSPRGVIETVLRRSGLDRLFQVWVSSDDVDCGKPAPDVFLLCAGLLGMAPERCVAVEDSRVGIKAAHTAGFRVIAVPNPVFPLDAETRALADVVVGSIAELDSELVESLVGKV